MHVTSVTHKAVGSVSHCVQHEFPLFILINVTLAEEISIVVLAAEVKFTMLVLINSSRLLFC